MALGVGEEHGIPYRRAGKIDGVDVCVWATGTEVEWSRCWWLPLKFRYDRKGPFVLGIRLVDPERTARGVTVHAATLRRGDGEAVIMRLTGDRDKPDEKLWPFHPNASQYIVHLFHTDTIEIDGPAVLEIDVSLVGPEGVVRKSLSLPVEIEIRRIDDWMFAT